MLLSDDVQVPEDTHQTFQIGRTIVTIRTRIQSKIPVFNTNESNMNKIKSTGVKLENFKDDDKYKIVEINGKRFLVRPLEDEDDENNSDEMDENEEAKNDSFDED